MEQTRKTKQSSSEMPGVYARREEELIIARVYYRENERPSLASYYIIL